MGRGGMQHSERCRARVIREISMTDAGRMRVANAEGRFTIALVEMSGENADGATREV